MNAENTKYLRENFPNLFKEYGGDPRQTCMAWGFSVGDGWFGYTSPLRLALLLGAGAALINSATADRFHRVWARLSQYSSREDQALVGRVLQAVRRDPGRRVLVTVRLERRHAVADWLSQVPDLILVSVCECTSVKGETR